MKFIKYISIVILTLNSVSGFSHNGCIYDNITLDAVNYTKLADKNSDLHFDLKFNLNGTGLAYSGRLVIVKNGGGSYYNVYLDTLYINATSTNTIVVPGLFIPQKNLKETFYYLDGDPDSVTYRINVQLIDAYNCDIGLISHQDAAINVELAYLTTNISTVDFSENAEKIKIYPNPSSGILNIEGQTNEYGISIYNSTGEKLKDYLNNINPVDISDLPQGMYMLVYSDKKKQKAVVKIEKK